MKKSYAYRITLTALFLATAIIVPQIFHVFPGSGAIFLPMHLPVLLCGLILGWKYGMAVGLCAPIINSLVSGMPVMAKVPFMTCELVAYGFMSGLLYHTLKLERVKIKKVPLGVILSLVLALIFGRGVYALSLIVAMYLLNIAQASPIAVFEAFVTGIPGIVIQLILIPILTVLAEKSLRYYLDVEKTV